MASWPGWPADLIDCRVSRWELCHGAATEKYDAPDWSSLAGNVLARGHRPAADVLFCVVEVIRKPFGTTYDPSGVWCVLHRVG